MFHRTSTHHARLCRACGRKFYGDKPLCIKCHPKEATRADEAHIED